MMGSFTQGLLTWILISLEHCLLVKVHDTKENEPHLVVNGYDQGLRNQTEFPDLLLTV